jgi:hypothetical protein
MTRRRALLLGSTAVVAALAVTGWIVSRQSAITRENGARISEGMTMAEVEAILGGPEAGRFDRPDRIRPRPGQPRLGEYRVGSRNNAAYRTLVALRHRQHRGFQ